MMRGLERVGGAIKDRVVVRYVNDFGEDELDQEKYLAQSTPNFVFWAEVRSTVRLTLLLF